MRLLLTFVIAGVSAAQTQPAFFRKDIFFTGNSLAAGDFNGDGRLDLVIGGEKRVRVLMNGGHGEFGQPVVTEGLYTNPAYFSTADFNRDGKSDLLVTFADPLGVTEVRLGRGDGTFQPPKQVELTLGGGVTGDFNSDTFPDIVSGYGQVCLGNGDGTFRYLAGISIPNPRFVADFNRDGKEDVAAGYERISIFLGRGDGTFDLPIVSELRVSSFLVADLNRDGLLDLTTQSGTALGTRDARFEPIGWLVIPGALEGTPLAAADFTRDGIVDVALSSSVLPAAGVWIFPGKNDGTFGLPMRQTVGGSPGWAISGDFDGDGRLDFATLNRISNTITLLLSETGNRNSLARAVSAASGTAIVRPGSLATLYNSFPVVAPQTAGPAPWPTRLAGVSLEIRDSAGTVRLAPLLYISETQINFLVPPDTALGEAALFIAVEGRSKSAGTMQVDAVAPGVFSITGRFPPSAGGNASDDRIVGVYSTGIPGASLMAVKCSFQDFFQSFDIAPCVIQHAGAEGTGLTRFDIRAPASLVQYVTAPPTSVYPVNVTLSVDGILANSVWLTAAPFR